MHHLQFNYNNQLQYFHNHSNTFTIVITLLSKRLGRYTQRPVGHCPEVVKHWWDLVVHRMCP